MSGGRSISIGAAVLLALTSCSAGPQPFQQADVEGYVPDQSGSAGTLIFWAGSCDEEVRVTLSAAGDRITVGAETRSAGKGNCAGTEQLTKATIRFRDQVGVKRLLDTSGSPIDALRAGDGLLSQVGTFPELTTVDVRYEP
ncbi:hypothetical protein [Actinocorallia longicatena]